MAVSSSAKRKQEDRLTQTLRELAALPTNKQCFDCNQRGPTYINMTAGSFVCTSCSGILRGLNPPHRVKSISMATFNNDEVDFVKARGNEYCRKIWLGLHDGPNPTTGGFKDENQIKDLLIQKYEKKRWYVSPAEIVRQQQYFDQAASRQHTSPSQSSLSSDRDGSLFSNEQISESVQAPQGPFSQPADLSRKTSNVSVNRPTVPASPMSNSMSLIDTSTPPAQKAKPPISHSVNAFSNGGMPPPPHAPVANSTAGFPVPSHQQQPNASGGFADFDSAFFGPPASVQQPSHEMNDLFSSSNFPKSQTVPTSLGIPPPQAVHSNNVGHIQPPPGSTQHIVHHAAPAHPQPAHAANPPPPMPSASDKYSALADLDDVFRTTTNGSSPTPTPVSGQKRVSTDESGILSASPNAAPVNHAPNFFASPKQAIVGGKPPVQPFGSPAANQPQLGSMGAAPPNWGSSPFGPPLGQIGFQSQQFPAGGVLQQQTAMPPNIGGFPQQQQQMFGHPQQFAAFQPSMAQGQWSNAQAFPQQFQGYPTQQQPTGIPSAALQMQMQAQAQQNAFGMRPGMPIDQAKKWNPFL